MIQEFVVFILTHNRVNQLKTYSAVRRAGYTGKIILVVDNEDPAQDVYRRLYPDEVYVFDKLEVSKRVDSMDLSLDRRAILYARNVCFDIAKELGYKYFLELDDDYTNFRSRIVDGDELSTVYIKDFDSLVTIMLEFLETSGAHSVAFSQIGDFIGGKGSKVCKDRITRKAMNSWFCTTSRPFAFRGRMNDDVCTYVLLGSMGYKFFTIADVSVDQLSTQSLSGGMSDTYSASGTYVKTFYSILCSPSSVKVYTTGVTNKRFHHQINWEHAVPKIISDKYKKEKLL